MIFLGPELKRKGEAPIGEERKFVLMMLADWKRERKQKLRRVE